MPLNGTLEGNSLYITLNSRPKEYHWGLAFTDGAGQVTLRHASNLRGPWVLDERASDPASSLTLIVMVRVSGILSVGNGDNSNNNGDDESEVLAAIATVPVDGSPSRRTGEPFDCRTWVKDVLVALRDHGCITLSADIDTIEKRAKNHAAEFASTCESGRGATVVNKI